MILNEDIFDDVNDIDLVESFNIVADGYAPNDYDKEWAIDDINNVHVNINDVVEYHVNEDADYFILTFKDGTKKAWYIHAGRYIPDKDFEESLKENKSFSLFNLQNWLGEHEQATRDIESFYKKSLDDLTKDEILDWLAEHDQLSSDCEKYFSISLKEDIDDVVVIDVPDVIADIKEDELTPSGPAVGEDTGIADLLLNLINGENDTIRDYNTFKANLDSHPEFVSVIDDIANEENNHVGMLQTLLKQISPNVETIKQGEAEAEKDLFDDDSQSFEVPDFEVDDSFDDGFGGIYA